MAKDRAAGRSGYRDGQEAWQATPQKLRAPIDDYNQQEPQGQAEILNRYATTPKLARTVQAHLARWHERGRDLDQDLSL